MPQVSRHDFSDDRDELVVDISFLIDVDLCAT